MLIFGLDMDVVVSPLYIQLCVDCGSPQVSDQCGDERERVLVAHHPLINIPVILYWPLSPVLFLNKEEG